MFAIYLTFVHRTVSVSTLRPNYLVVAFSRRTDHQGSPNSAFREKISTGALVQSIMLPSALDAPRQ